MKPSGRLHTLGPGALSGLLLALSYPPLHPLVLPFVALVPWVVALDRCDDAREAFRTGLVVAGVHFGLVAYWIPLALGDVTRLAWALFAAGLGLIALVVGVGASVLHRALRSPAVPLWLAVPTVWTGIEWSLAHLPGSMAYSWLGLGTTLTGFPVLVGFAEYVGAAGVCFWIASVNGVAAAALLGRIRWTARSVAAGLLLVVVPPSVGFAAARTHEADVSTSVAVVRTDVPQATRRGDRAVDELLSAVERATRGIEPGSVDLVVLPEGTLPVTTESTEWPAASARIQAISVELGAPVLFGVGTTGDDGVNRALLMEPRGLVDYRYDKRRRVPIAEAAPWARPSEDPTDLPLVSSPTGVRYAVLICYESSFPELARGLRRAGADVLVNITNDAWSGGGGDRLRTTAYWQHPAHLVMRAIETRAGIVRSANGGFAFVVDPLGHVRGAVESPEGHIVATVTSSSEPTVFERTGDVIGLAAGVVFWILAAVLGLGSVGVRIPGRDRP